MLICIIEPPRVITLDDIALPKKRNGGSVKDWELHGILQCFLELEYFMIAMGYCAPIIPKQGTMVYLGLLCSHI